MCESYSHGKSSCHLVILVNILKYLFCTDILPKNELKQCVDMSAHANPSVIPHEQYNNFEHRKITQKQGHLITLPYLLGRGRKN